MKKVDITKADLNFGIDQFCFDDDLDLGLFDADGTDDNRNSRYIRPRLDAFVKANIRYSKAEDLAKDVTIGKGERMNVVVSGNFVYGDFLEAWLVENDCEVEDIWISTLSMSEQNTKSLEALMRNGWIDDLHLFLSAYFYAHEQTSMMPTIMNTLDIDNRFQCSISSMHVKVITMRMADGRFITIHGSANLRSSACIEQFCIEEGEELYNFYVELFTDIENKFRIIQKAVRGNDLWKGLDKKIKKRDDD